MQNYEDYRALVYCYTQGTPIRKFNKENTFVFHKQYEISPNQSIQNQTILQQIISEKHHGILGEGYVRIICRENHPPYIVAYTTEGLILIDYEMIQNDYIGTKEFSIEYQGYRISGYIPLNHQGVSHVYMETPDKETWRCKYGDKRFKVKSKSERKKKKTRKPSAKKGNTNSTKPEKREKPCKQQECTLMESVAYPFHRLFI